MSRKKITNSLVRKLYSQVEYTASVVHAPSGTRVDTPEVSGYDTHGQVALTLDEEAVLRRLTGAGPAADSRAAL